MYYTILETLTLIHVNNIVNQNQYILNQRWYVLTRPKPIFESEINVNPNKSIGFKLCLQPSKELRALTLQKKKRSFSKTLRKLKKKHLYDI